MRSHSLSMQALRSSILLMPYLDVVNAAGWLRLRSNGVLSSSCSLAPTWKDLKASENSLTGTNRYGSFSRTQYCC